MEKDPRLWVSRSWTTRAQRQGEPDDAYVFVDRETFIAALERGEFLETNEFAANDHLYGTPWPKPPSGDLDVVLDIDVNGARQVKHEHPDAIAVLVEPPSWEELARRMRLRGDSDEHITRRLELGKYEVAAGRDVADHVVVNDDLDRAVDEVARILEARRLDHP